MLAEIYPLQVLLMTFSGLVNRHQADVIAYLVEENRVLKEQMKDRKLRLTEDQRRRLPRETSGSRSRLRMRWGRCVSIRRRSGFLRLPVPNRSLRNAASPCTGMGWWSA